MITSWSMKSKKYSRRFSQINPIKAVKPPISCPRSRIRLSGIYGERINSSAYCTSPGRVESLCNGKHIELFDLRRFAMKFLRIFATLID